MKNIFSLSLRFFYCSLSKKDDFKKTQNTEFAQKITTAHIAPGLLACQRESLPRTAVGNVLGQCGYSIGDVSLSKFVKRKSLVDFFSLINTQSIFSRTELGQDIGGFTHPTIQLNGGPCKLPFHIEHWGSVSVNVLHWGPAKVWYIIHPKHFIPAILCMQRLQESADLGNFWGICDDTTSHRDMFYDMAHLESVECQRIVQMPGEGVFLFLPCMQWKILEKIVLLALITCLLIYFHNVRLIRFAGIRKDSWGNHCLTQ